MDTRFPLGDGPFLPPLGRLAVRFVSVAVAAAVIFTNSGVDGRADRVAEVPPFPEPIDAWGRFHTLSLFRCETQLPRAPDGSCGFLFRSGQQGAAGRPRRVSLGEGTCAGPLADMSSLYDLPAGGTTAKLTAGVSAVRSDRAVSLTTTDTVRGHYAKDTQYYPLGPSGRGPSEAQFPLSRPGLHYETAVGRALALMRNTFAGGIHRVSGEYDVLAVSRLTIGVCRFWNCSDLSAVDIASGGGASNDLVSGDRRRAALLVMPTPEGGLATLSVMDTAVLSLGHRAFVDPRWLAGSPLGQGATPWNLNSRVLLFRPTSSAEIVPEALEFTSYIMQNFSSSVSVESSSWLRSMSYILCQEPAHSFVQDPVTLCAGVPSGRALAPGDAGDFPTLSLTGSSSTLTSELNGKRLPPPQRRLIRLGFRWDMDPWGRGMPKQCGNLSLPSAAERPRWLAGVGAREINPASADEVALAGSISSCLYIFDRNHSFPLLWSRLYYVLTEPQDFGEVQGQMLDLAQSYSAKVFGAEPPGEPASLADILLSVIVVIPEMVAMVAMVVDSRPWNLRGCAILGLFFLSGIVSAAGVIALAMAEHSGANWRAAAVRDDVAVEQWLPAESMRKGAVIPRDLRGLPIIRTETLYVIARSGYRPRLLVGIAAGTCAAYLVVSAAVAAAVLMQSRRLTSHSLPGSWRKLGKCAWRRRKRRQTPSTAEQDTDAEIVPQGWDDLPSDHTTLW